MATFGQMQLLSSDEEDEDYVDSEASDNEDDNEKDKNDKKKKKGLEREKQSTVEIIRARKMQSALSKMMIDSLISLEHEPTVKQSDLLLEFQARNFSPTQPISTVEQLYEYLSRTAGSCKPHTTHLDNVEEFKASVRASSSSPVDVERIRHAVQNLNSQDAEVRVERTVRFAGQAVSIQQKMKRDSRKYQNYLKTSTGKRKLGGSFVALDSAIDQLKNLQTVTSVEKSKSDWEIYREKHKLEQELENSAKDGYLAKQAFLAAVDSTQQEMALQVQKKRRMLMELNANR